MTTTAFILSIIILLIIMGKWIVFIILSPLFVIYNKRNQRISHKVAEQDKRLLEYPESETSQNLKFQTPHISLKSHLRSYFDGYLRYMQFQVGYIPSHHIRDFIYRKIYLVDLGKNAIIYFGAEIRGGYNLQIGNGAIIGDKAVLDARRGGIIIGENVQLGSFVKLWTGSHDMNDPYFRSMPGKRGPIKIGNRAWLGPNVTVLHSVTIGEGAVIAAGSVVTKDVEPFAVMGGIPAKKIGERSQDLKYQFEGNYIPFY